MTLRQLLEFKIFAPKHLEKPYNSTSGYNAEVLYTTIKNILGGKKSITIKDLMMDSKITTSPIFTNNKVLKHTIGILVEDKFLTLDVEDGGEWKDGSISMGKREIDYGKNEQD